MAARHSKELKSVLREYINKPGTAGEKLRLRLQATSVESRLNLLKNVKGDNGYTGLHGATLKNDLETMKSMLQDFTWEQKYDVAKIRSSFNYTAVHLAAHHGCSSIITYLLTDFSQQQRYDVLKMQCDDGATPLHDAALKQQGEVIHTILTLLTAQQQIQLLNITNKKGKKVPDIRPELHKEVTVLISQGVVEFYVLSRIFCRFFYRFIQI